mmetsp:Transcript_55516/g.119829  ORF Transcript_55516/g.119829 Transcript_55516/m.119829 type:complete len:215 (+) Transcript_55516:266-910(+)
MRASFGSTPRKACRRSSASLLASSTSGFPEDATSGKAAAAAWGTLELELSLDCERCRDLRLLRRLRRLPEPERLPELLEEISVDLRFLEHFSFEEEELLEDALEFCFSSRLRPAMALEPAWGEKDRRLGAGGGQTGAGTAPSFGLASKPLFPRPLLGGGTTTGGGPVLALEPMMFGGTLPACGRRFLARGLPCIPRASSKVTQVPAMLAVRRPA